MKRERAARGARALRAADAREAESLARIRRFLAAPHDPFERDNPEGHVTGSAVVARPDGSAFLLVLHRKLGRWLQPGGHTEESDASVFDTALREAREETGLAAFEVPLEDAILDVDVHPIPARGRDAAHLHFDVRYLLVTRRDARPRRRPRTRRVRCAGRASRMRSPPAPTTRSCAPSARRGRSSTRRPKTRSGRQTMEFEG